MSAPPGIERPRPILFHVAMAALLLSAAAFAVIAQQVATAAPILARDVEVSVWLHTHGNPVLTAVLLVITQLHSVLGVFTLSLIAAFFVWRKGDRLWVLALALVVPGGMLINTLLKVFFDRARPTWDDPLLTLTTGSFPSGHATGSTLFYGFLACYLVWRMKSGSARALAILGCMAMVVLVGFSRVYLGVHYLSDVLAGVSLGTAWLALCMIAVRAVARRRDAMGAG